MEIKLQIAESCEHCKKALKWFKSLERKHPERYANINMNTMKSIDGLIIIPDYNCNGYLTHWHLMKADKWSLLRTFDSLLEMEEGSKRFVMMKKLTKTLKKNFKELKNDTKIKNG